MTREQEVLACCLISKDAYQDLVRMGLTSAMFKDYPHIFQAIVKYRTENDVEYVLISNLKLDEAVRAEMLLWPIDDVHLFERKQYFKALEEQYIAREKRRIVEQQPNTRQGCLASALALTALAQSGEIVEESLTNLIEQTIEVVQDRQREDYKSKFAFGEKLKLIDKLGYYEPGSLVTLGGGSGHGKSTFALNMVLHWLSNGLSAIYFSNEFNPIILLAKLVCIKTGIYWRKLMNSTGERLSNEEYTAAIAALDAFRNDKLKLYTRKYSLPEMSLIVKTYKPDVFILDTINALIAEETRERTDISLGNMARQMKVLAEEIDGLGIVVAQLKDIHGRPTDKDLVKESRQIRDASDYMDFIYREFEQRPYSKYEQLREVFELYRVKGRYTGIGHAFLHFNKENGRITEYSKSDLREIVEYMSKYKNKLYSLDN